MAMTVSPSPSTPSPQEPLLEDANLFSQKTEYAYHISIHNSRSLRPKDFYGTFRRTALNQNIREITSERSVDLLQALIPLFNWIQKPEDTTTIQDAIEKNIGIRMISSDNVVVRSRFSAMAGPRDWRWFIEKGAIFSTVVNRIAEKCTVLFLAPVTLSMLWINESAITLKPEFAGRNAFLDGVQVQA
ncbi:hypothetical protein M407DRAFT_32569 [Tulasnella calospora MUT 4182]|uniref:Uncharacterized protein n=1 Tax=Tulasnella calospora MUT 4182 TaxID=1051891 RepID=A0A0C3L8A0_9AGAM|nr:hypothetical protein M407DRAFT_32569 [Tulasnella calospora MUT 4182]